MVTNYNICFGNTLIEYVLHYKRFPVNKDQDLFQSSIIPCNNSGSSPHVQKNVQLQRPGLQQAYEATFLPRMCTIHPNSLSKILVSYWSLA
uniref:Beta-galactosidase 9 n=1 Tax=Rhizophora mucronata TaxID=61149 RepID=A0A2P2L5L4_RHIMU